MKRRGELGDEAKRARKETLAKLLESLSDLVERLTEKR